MSNTALLVMDVQRGVVARYGDDPDYLPRLGTAVIAARAAGVRVIYVVIGFRSGYPEIGPNNKIFSGIAARSAFNPGDAITEIHPDVAPSDGDIIVTKRRVSAFTGSDLDLVLRAQGITSLVLTGIATSGVVLSTLRQAADLDYALTVLEDGCVDADPEVHAVLTGKVFPHQAEVTTIDTWTAGL